MCVFHSNLSLSKQNFSFVFFLGFVKDRHLRPTETHRAVVYQRARWVAYSGAWGGDATENVEKGEGARRGARGWEGGATRRAAWGRAGTARQEASYMCLSLYIYIYIYIYTYIGSRE